MKDLLEYLARGSSSTRRGQVNEVEDDGTIILELSVDEDDYGSVIGRGGRTAMALRAVIKVAAVQEQRRVR